MAKKKNENIVEEEIITNENFDNTTIILEETSVLDEAQPTEELSSNIEENEPKIEDNELIVVDEQLEIVVDEQLELASDTETFESPIEILKTEVKQTLNIGELNYSQHRHYLRTGRIPK